MRGGILLVPTSQPAVHAPEQPNADRSQIERNAPSSAQNYREKEKKKQGVRGEREGAYIRLRMKIFLCKEGLAMASLLHVESYQGEALG